MSSDAVHKIKERLSIVDVVSPYVELMSAGKNLKGKSPFTNERTPSFYVSPDRGMFYCFSSNKGGDIFTFLQEIEGVDFKGALKILAERAGVSLEAEDPKKRTERETIYAVLAEASSFFESHRAIHELTQVYLKKRGVHEDTVRAWHIGYAPGPPQAGWRVLYDHLKQLGYETDILLKAGLVKSSGENKDPYDVFRNRIMFPLFDATGRVVAFSGRQLETTEGSPKYVNSPETELYKKSELLYGYNIAKQGIRTLGFSLIVEGQFDVIMCHQAGYQNAVAVSGTALTDHHVGLLQRLSNKVVLALDSDKAGIRAVKKAALLMLRRGMEVKVATFQTGTDPADAVLSDPKQFKHTIGNSIHVIEYVLQLLRLETKDSRAFVVKIREEVIPIIASIPSAIDQEYFAGVAADAATVSVDAIKLELQRFSGQQNRTLPTLTKVSTNSQFYEKDLPTNKPISSEKRQRVLEEHLSIMKTRLSESEQAAIEVFLNKELQISLERVLLEMVPERRNELEFRIESQFMHVSVDGLRQEFEDMINRLIEIVFKEKDHMLRNRLSEAEQLGQEVQVSVLLSEISVLHNTKNQLQDFFKKL